MLAFAPTRPGHISPRSQKRTHPPNGRPRDARTRELRDARRQCDGSDVLRQQPGPRCERRRTGHARGAVSHDLGRGRPTRRGGEHDRSRSRHLSRAGLRVRFGFVGEPVRDPRFRARGHHRGRGVVRDRRPVDAALGQRLARVPRAISGVAQSLARRGGLRARPATLEPAWARLGSSVAWWECERGTTRSSSGEAAHSRACAHRVVRGVPAALPDFARPTGDVLGGTGERDLVVPSVDDGLRRRLRGSGLRVVLGRPAERVLQLRRPAPRRPTPSAPRSSGPATSRASIATSPIAS